MWLAALVRTYRCYVAELVPADCEEFERVDEDSCAGYVPEGEYDDGVYDDLGAGLVGRRAGIAR